MKKKDLFFSLLWNPTVSLFFNRFRSDFQRFEIWFWNVQIRGVFFVWIPQRGYPIGPRPARWIEKFHYKIKSIIRRLREIEIVIVKILVKYGVFLTETKFSSSLLCILRWDWKVSKVKLFSFVSEMFCLCTVQDARVVYIYWTYRAEQINSTE